MPFFEKKRPITTIIVMQITIPTSWADISIEQFTQIYNLKKEEDIIDYMLDLIGVCCKLSHAEVMRLDLKTINTIYSKLDWINQMPSGKIESRIEIDKVLYISDLAIEKITADQYINIKNAITAGPLGNVHNIMATLYIPYKKKFNEVPINEVADKFYADMPISFAYPVAVFFCNLLNDSMRDIEASLELKVKQSIETAMMEMRKN
jgi:hypothetical protein